MATSIILTGMTTAAFADANLDTIKINVNGVDKTLRQLNGVVTNTTTITVPNYGTFTKGAEVSKDITFTAAATYPSGKITLTEESGKAEFAKVDFSAATGAVEVTATAITATVLGGLGADKLTAADVTASINGGAGDDTITAGVTGGLAAGATVKGGLGADQFKHADASVKMNVADYNYAEGDTLILANNFNDGAGTETALSKTGAFVDKTGGAMLSGTAALADNAYKVKVTDATAATREYWTAAQVAAVTLDGSAKTDALRIDATNALTAVVTGGKGDDAINITNSQATLTASKSDGTDTIAGFTFGYTGDVLNLKDAVLSDVTWGTTSSSIGLNTILKGIGGAKQEILVQENSGATKKVAFSTATAQSLAMTDSKVADVYVGMSSTTKTDTTILDATGVTGAGTVINLLDTAKYKNITDIKGAVGGGTYVGAVNSHDTTSATGTNFDLTAAGTKASQVWGGSKAADSIALLATNAAQDVVWFGTTDGTDKVTGFKAAGYSAINDVVNLHDVADISTLAFADSTGAAGKGVNITTATGNVLDLQEASGAALTNNAIQLLLKDKSGTVKKVAVGAANANAKISAVDADGVDADMVIGHVGTGDSVVYGANQKTNLVVNLLDTAKYKNIADVDVSGAANGSNIVVGASNINSAIKLGGTTSEVWGGSSFANAITAGAGADTIWYGNNDGADAITGFSNAADKIKFYDKSVAELAKAYTWNGTTTFTSTTTATDSLNVGVTGTINVVDKNNNVAKVVLSAAGAFDYAKDAKVYMGSAANTTLNVASTDNVVLYLGNGKDATVNDIYFSGVTGLDASASTGQTVLIGSASKADVLKGGTTSSAMWGGGSAADQMVGQVNAIDEFWFGTGDGADKVTGTGTTKQDKIVLHNITSIADVTMTVDTVAGNFVVTAKDGSTLTVDDAGAAALDGGLTFQFGVNADAKSYTYNRISKTFNAK